MFQICTPHDVFSHVLVNFWALYKFDLLAVSLIILFNEIIFHGSIIVNRFYVYRNDLFHLFFSLFYLLSHMICVRQYHYKIR